MAKTPCELWHELIHSNSPYIGPIYAEFAKEKTTLLNHLYSCKRCKGMVDSLFPNSQAPDYRKMSDPDFFTGIRDLRNLSKQRKLGGKIP